MAYAALVHINKGQVVPVYVESDAQAGDTLKIAPSPAMPLTSPKFTFRELATSVVIVPFNNVDILSGNYTNPSTASSKVLLWYVLDTSALLVKTLYVAEFSFAVISTLDGITRQEIVKVIVEIE